MPPHIKPRLLALALASALATSPIHAQMLVPQPAPAAGIPEGFIVSDIRLEGLQRIAAGTAFTHLPIQRGDRVDRAVIAGAVRSLFASGFFNDVQVARQGDILVVTLTERPAIDKVTLIGNKDIKTDELTRVMGEAGLAEGDTFDRKNLDRLVQELFRQYNNRGKYNARIDPQVTPLDRNRVSLTLDITEGKASRIRHINIVGNEQFKEKDLRQRWESDTTNWMSWFRRDDQYSREKLSGDLEKLNAWYLDRGYVDFSIESQQVEISPDLRDMAITANIVEGDVYTVSKVEVTGDTILPQEQVEALVRLVPGMIFSRRLIEMSSDAIMSVLANIGYAFSEVTPIPDVNREDKTVDLKLFVDPGPRVFVRRIQINGNLQTSDDVVRRELRQFEGAWYSQAAIDRSKVRLQRLGFFENVDIETERLQGTPDQVDLVVKVTERNAGQFTFGLGFSQVSGLITTVQVVQDNFLGTGTRVSATVQRNTFSNRLDFGFIDPYFTDDGISVGYNFFFRDFQAVDANLARFTSDTFGASATFGVPLSETDSIGVRFGIDSNQIFVLDGFSPVEFLDFINRVGNRTFKSWRAEVFWSRDSRNHFFVPTRGLSQRLSLEATLPGSTAEYYKVQYQLSHFLPLHRWVVLNSRLDLGFGDGYGDVKELPFFENFIAGGTRSVRGFRDNTLGPVGFAELSTFRQPLGGSLKTVGGVDFVFPSLFKTDAARVAAFIDVGNVFDGIDGFEQSELRASYGVSLQWQAPVGPIIISYAIPLRDKADDELERLQFTFGTAF
ncbi:MAG: outer membrane protein assembly factor BamA [Xanthomonadaceae bacterium]|nr:outer membrane protein assembly factor BamA [Xanthomonadaceae bacterium]